MKERLKDYFSFNKKERNGILLLSFVLLLLIVFYQFAHLLKTETTTDFSVFEKAIAELEYSKQESPKQNESTLFYFNPNTLDDKGWLALGLSEGKLQALRNYQKSGGYFKAKQDLKRCYAIGDDFYEKIKNYVSIPAIKNTEQKAESSVTEIQPIELNTADSVALISIKGIGPFYAKQILKYRNELGGFLDYNQFKEIWGLEKLDLAKLKTQSTIDAHYIQKININRADIDGLRAHPYLNYKQAKMIVNFRHQHGSFQSIAEIQKIKPISPELFRKIAPYLTVDDK